MQRLYTLFQPERYDLTLNLQRIQRTFSGSVTVVGTVSREGKIYLHAKDLQITKAEVDGQAAEWQQEGDELALKPQHSLEEGPHTVTVAFSGTITDPMHGLYPCYFEHDGVKKEWLATQFESHHAREVFPCVDEPEAKAVFDVTLETEKNVEVLGNMPAESQSEKGEALVTTFATTSKMSTYLLAFVVGEMQSKEMKTKGGILVRTFATPAQAPESLDFALKHAADTIDFFDEYFGVPYPLPKCDNVALPDFSSGAMENWGLITYRETTLLVDPANTPVAGKQLIAGVITHELSHQWFGNLVTMRWWDDLWLNESFASLMEYVGVHALYPDWDVWLDFGPNDRAPALHRDMLPGVQAIKTDVHHPDEISSLFDPAIVYAKGSAVLNMVKNYIGEEAFREGLQHYFNKHQYGNTEGSDLWAAFGEASGQDINSFMTAWIEKPGYPVVSIDQQGAKATLSQQRLLVSQGEDDSLWPIPLFAEPSLGISQLEERKQTVELPDDTYRLLNKDSSGLFVTHYIADDHRAHLAAQLKDSSLAAADRLRLLHEALLLARVGEQSLVEALHLALSASNENRDAVWDIMSLAIADTRRFVEHDKTLEDRLKHLVREFAGPQLEALGFEPQADDSAETKKRRATLLGLCVWSEHKAALDHALEQFDSFKKPEDLDADLRGIVYSAGARWHGKQAYEKLFALYKSTDSAEERQALASGMAATKDLEVIKILLSHIKDTSIVRTQDTTFWFVHLIRKREARELAWAWLVDEWDWIESKFKGDKTYDAFPRYASAILFGQEWLQSYRDFFEPKMSQRGLKRTIAIGLEDIKSRTVWFERDEPRLREFLSQD